jgi:hypothetical protein
MLQLDRDLGDIQADIADCQASLVRQLEDYLLSEEVYTVHTLLLLLFLHAWSYAKAQLSIGSYSRYNSTLLAQHTISATVRVLIYGTTMLTRRYSLHNNTHVHAGSAAADI